MATPSIMAGGDKEVFQALMPLFQAMGQKIVHHGGSGSGQHAKLCNQIAIAGTMVSVCESLLYGYKAGLNLNTVLQSISGGAAACWTLVHLAPRILRGNFDPGFLVDHFSRTWASHSMKPSGWNCVCPASHSPINSICPFKLTGAVDAEHTPSCWHWRSYHALK